MWQPLLRKIPVFIVILSYFFFSDNFILFAQESNKEINKIIFKPKSNILDHEGVVEFSMQAATGLDGRGLKVKPVSANGRTAIFNRITEAWIFEGSSWDHIPTLTEEDSNFKVKFTAPPTGVIELNFLVMDLSAAKIYESGVINLHNRDVSYLKKLNNNLFIQNKVDVETKPSLAPPLEANTTRSVLKEKDHNPLVFGTIFTIGTLAGYTKMTVSMLKFQYG